MPLRLARPSDGPQVAAIYRPYVEDTPISFEVVAPDGEAMAERITATMPAFPWLVALGGDRVDGYAYAHPFAPRPAYQWAAETSVYVRADAHRRGCGRRLYTALLELLAAQGFTEALAGITLPNPGSVGLHETLGFEPVATYPRVGWKLGQWHDVGWWQRPLSTGAIEGEPPAPRHLDEIDPAIVAAALA